MQPQAREVADVPVAETPEQTIARLREENRRLRAYEDFWERKMGNLLDADPTILILGLQKLVLNQKTTLRQLNEALWSRRQTIRKLRQRVDEQKERLRGLGVNVGRGSD
jgi:hypothetical protein